MTTTRRRPISAFANDELIRETTVSLLAKRGIAGVTLASVAREAELSHTAMSKRFGDRDDLLCDVWTHSSSKQLDAIMEWSALLTSDSSRGDDSLHRVPRGLIQQNDENLAFVELLIVALTTPKLRASVRKSFENHLGIPTRVEPVRAAQLAFLLAMIIGILCENRTVKINVPAVIEVTREVVEALTEPAEVVALPHVSAPHFTTYVFNTGDERRDRILASCLTNVGKHGFDDTTTKMIVHDADVSEGLLFSMFDSKIDIFLEASMIQARLGFKTNLDFVINLNEKYGRGIGNAILMKAWMSPDLSDQRIALLEQSRVSWHEPQFRRRLDKFKDELFASEKMPMPSSDRGLEERAVEFVQIAIPTGLYLVVENFPGVAELPFSAVTQKVFV